MSPSRAWRRRDVSGQRLLDSAGPGSVTRDVKVAEVLLEHGADTAAQDEDGYTPLHVAAVYGYTGTARVLLKHGAYPNAQDLFGRTLLHRASIEGYVGVARVLLEYGGDARAQDILNRAPLHRASEEGYLELARVLLLHEADVGARDKDGKTPLRWSSERRHMFVATRAAPSQAGAWRRCECPRCGADVQVWNNEGWSPFQEASTRGWDDVVQFLWEHGGH